MTHYILAMYSFLIIMLKKIIVVIHALLLKILSKRIFLSKKESEQKINKNGKMIGYWICYYENGQLESESIIKDGVEELKLYDKKGNLLPKGEGC